ncbi:MAG: CHAD domain-containing protein [Mariniphaga sp.]|nr:CHAD domain-containing protein [Mariniphaga sp.]
MSSNIKGNRSGKTAKPVSFQRTVERDISKLHPFTVENLLDVDKSIHQLRKSLKSVSAILLLYKEQFDQTQYINGKSLIKSLSKQYGVVREPYVYLQTFNRIENELKGIGDCNPDELRSHFELQYQQTLNGGSGNETIQQGNKSILKLTETLTNFEVTSDPKRLRRKLSVSFRRAKKLFIKLKTNSSADDFHEFRKWCKIFYFQQAALHRLGKGRAPKKNIQLYILTEYLGKEHDLQMLFEYMVLHFAVLSCTYEPFFKLKIKKLRKKVLALYPKVNYL